MNIILADLYKDFECIADACPNTCCAGWNIHIDNKTYQKMVDNEDKMGIPVQDWILEEENTYKVQLEKNGRCPMLNEKDLCKVVLTLGSSYLSRTCTSYPRVYRQYGNVIEGHLASSCPHVIDMLMSKENVFFDFSEDDTSEYGRLYLYEYAVRTSIIDLLYHFRELFLNTRLFAALNIIDRAISNCTSNTPDYNVVKEYIDSYYVPGVMTSLNNDLTNVVKESSRYNFLQNIINIYHDNITPVPKHIELAKQTLNYFEQNNFEQYSHDVTLFKEAIKPYHNFYTNYWVYRIFSETIEIPDYTKVKEKFIYIGIEFCLIQAMALASFVQNQTLDREEYIYIISSISRMEHVSRQELVEQLRKNNLLSTAGLLLLII